MGKFEVFEEALCKELDNIKKKILSGGELTDQELERMDKIAHTMKSFLSYEVMKASVDQEEGMSGRRGRGPDGRYVSMDGGSSYAEGYSRGFMEGQAQHRMMSGANNSSYADGYSRGFAEGQAQGKMMSNRI